MPNPQVQPLFDRARALGIGFYLGYAERTPEGRRFNAAILVEPDGTILGRYRKVHLPGSVEPRAGDALPAAREALFRLRRPRLPRLPRRPGLARRDHGHDDLQRPPLAGSLARARPAGRRAGLPRLQFRRLRPERRHDGGCRAAHLPFPAGRAGQRLHERDLGGGGRQGGRRGRLRPDRRLLHRRPRTAGSSPRPRRSPTK